MEIYYNDLKPEYNVIDIRDKIDYDKGHFINSINIPYNILLSNPSKYLEKKIEYYLYCTSGIRSRKASELLSILGYKVINVKDGYKDKL